MSNNAISILKDYRLQLIPFGSVLSIFQDSARQARQEKRESSSCFFSTWIDLRPPLWLNLKKRPVKMWMGIGQFNSEKRIANENNFIAAHATTICECFLYLFSSGSTTYLPTCNLRSQWQQKSTENGLTIHRVDKREGREKKSVCVCMAAANTPPLYTLLP